MSATVGPHLGYVFRMDLVGPPPEPAEAAMVGLLADPGVEVDPATVVTAEDAGAALGSRSGRPSP